MFHEMLHWLTPINGDASITLINFISDCPIYIYIYILISSVSHLDFSSSLV